MQARRSLSVILIAAVLLLSSAAGAVRASPTLLLEKTWGGKSTDYARDVVSDPSGNLYLVGYTYGFFLGYTAFLLRYNSAGALVWEKLLRPGLESADERVAIDRAGNLYALGETVNSLANVYSWNIFLVKISPSGDLLWNATWGGAASDAGDGIAIDSAGNVYVAGSTRSFGAGMSDALLLVFDSAGNLLWQRMLGGLGGAEGRDLVVGADGSLFLVGDTYSGTYSGAGSSYVLILKLNSTGYVVWQRTWGNGSGNYGMGIALDSHGTILVAGETNDTGLGYKAVLLTLDSTGNLTSASLWGGHGNDAGLSVASDNSGNAFLAGYVSEPPPYASTLGNTTLDTHSFAVSDLGNGTLGVPSYAPGSANMNVTSISGSENYAGDEELFLLKYQISAVGAEIPPQILLLVAVIVGPLFSLLKRRK